MEDKPQHEVHGNRNEKNHDEINKENESTISKNENTNEEIMEDIKEGNQTLSKNSNNISELNDLERNENFSNEELEKINEEVYDKLNNNPTDTNEIVEPQENGNSNEKIKNFKKRNQRILNKDSTNVRGHTEPQKKVKYSEKNIEKIRKENQVIISKKPMNISEFIELQCCNCSSGIIDKSIRCRACIAKQTDVCRFKFTRFFKKGKVDQAYGNVFMQINEAEKYLKNIDPGYTHSGKKSNVIDDFIIPKIKCAPINDYDKGNEKENMRYIEKYLAPSLACTYARELTFLNENRENLRYRPMIAPVNQNCDRCKTGISCFYYLCQRCGSEICLDCYDNFEEEIGIRVYPLRCRKKENLFHLKEMFLPYSNFTLSAIDNIFCSFNFNKKELLIPTQNLTKRDLYLPQVNIESNEFPNDSMSEVPSEVINNTVDSTNFNEKELPIQTDNKIKKELHLSEIKVKSHEYPHGPLSQFPIEIFQKTWQNGIPMVINVDSSKALHSCNPEFFIKYYGEADIDVLRLDNKPGKNMKVKDFFYGFLNKEGGLLDRKGNQIPIKIKDWPSTLSFKEYFKCLYNDFMNALPYPTYMRYDGPFNLISHLPDTSITPDLGPKMYNSYPNTEHDTIFGTTPLHCDAADAINKMEYCSGGDDSIGAIWDIFRREDVDDIRKFIFKKFNGIAIFDPIHDQNYYLNDELLNDLYNEYGIKGYRIYQKVGDAILIPAGCAHQVRNIHHCIKIAMDYVAPESIPICAKLTSEFRKLPYKHSRCTDIISTKALMLNVWNKVNEIVKGKPLFGSEQVLTYKNNANKSSSNSKTVVPKRKINVKEEIEAQDETQTKESNSNIKPKAPKRKAIIEKIIKKVDGVIEEEQTKERMLGKVRTIK